MRIVALVISLFAVASVFAQPQTTPDFEVECPCTLEAKHQRDASVYSCVEFYKNAAYKVEVMYYPNGIPDGLSEKEHLLGYYADLEQRDLTPEWVTFWDNLAVLYRITEPFSTRQNIISDNIVFFWGGKRYQLIVTTLSGTRRTLFKDFSNSFVLK